MGLIRISCDEDIRMIGFCRLLSRNGAEDNHVDVLLPTDMQVKNNQRGRTCHDRIGNGNASQNMRVIQPPNVLVKTALKNFDPADGFLICPATQTEGNDAITNCFRVQKAANSPLCLVAADRHAIHV